MTKSTNQFHAENGLPVKPTIIPKIEANNDVISVYLDTTGVNSYNIKKIIQQEGDVALLLEDVHVIVTGLDDELLSKAEQLKYEFIDKHTGRKV